MLSYALVASNVSFGRREILHVIEQINKLDFKAKQDLVDFNFMGCLDGVELPLTRVAKHAIYYAEEHNIVIREAVLMVMSERIKTLTANCALPTVDDFTKKMNIFVESLSKLTKNKQIKARLELFKQKCIIFQVYYNYIITDHPYKNKCDTCGNTDKPVLVCSKCQFVQYCSKHCQRGDWKRHQTECTKM